MRPDPTVSLRQKKKTSQFSSVMERLRRKRASQTPAEIEPLPRDGRPLPLSSTQQRLWFIEQLHPGTATYNLGSNVELRGSLDLAVLGEAFRQVMTRHESLRTQFDERGGEPFQVIVAEVRLSMPLIDLSAVALKRRELAAMITRLRAMPFNLRRAPLFNAAVLRLSPSEHVLVMSQHHIVSDGWSSSIVIRETMAFYEAALGGGLPRLPALPIQYADYAAWQRKTMDDTALAEDLEFWVRHLEGAPPVLDLPGDRPRPAVQSHRGAMHLLRCSARLTEGLRSLSRSCETTLFVVLMASYQSLLRQWSGQDDFALGIPIAHRRRTELSDLVGYFANTLALRAGPGRRVGFVEQVKRLQELMLEVHHHQSVPFERLVEKLQPERSLSHTPIFQVLFSFQNVPAPRLELPGLRLEPLPIGDGTAIFDLTLDLADDPEGLGGWFEYSTDLFDPTTMCRLEIYFRNLLEGLVASPDGAPSEVSLLSAAERHQVLEEWNDTRWAAGDSERPAVPRLFAAAARRDPDAVAVVFAGEVLSYGGLNARANRLAHHLRSLGVGPEARVGVALERSTGLVVSLLAILKAGGAYVPLDPEYPRQRLADMMGDAGLQALVARRRYLGRLGVPRGVQVVELDSVPEEELETDPPAAAIDLHAAYLIFTSGSTGRPKATVVPHRGVDNRLLWIQEVYPLGKGDRVLQKTPFTFDVSVWELFWPLLSGATLVVARPGEHRDPRALANRIERHRVTVIHFVPSMLGVFFEHPGVEQRCATLRRVFVSGEALSEELARRFFRRLSLPLENLYGPTEASIEVTHWRGRPPSEPRGAPRFKVSIGRPIGNLRILLFDRFWRPVPLGVAGELAIGGVAVARVYRGRPRLTAERFVPDPFVDTDRPGTRLYRSGDLARFLNDGQIEFLGRLDHQVKVRGFRVELGEIESRLREHPAVREAVVTPQQGEGPSVRSGAARLVAYAVATDPKTPPRLEQLRPFLKESLPEYMIPAALVVLEAMPLGPSGKLDRRRLPRPVFERASSRYVAPRTPIEEALAGFVSEVLERPQVGLYDDFFELGGHSLLATRIVSRVQAVLDVEVALTAFFEAPTVAGIAARVEAARAAGRESPAPPLVPQPRDRPLPLSFAQERMWFLDQLVPGTPFYNLPVHFSLEGPLSAAVLDRVLTEVTRRHEVLRTVFSAENGQPRQLIGAPAPVAMPVVDLAGLAPAARRQAVERLSRDEARRPFDLTSDWPLRAVLLHEAAEEHAMLLTLHHIASDGWSMGLLVREVMVLYEAFGRGEASPLADLRVQYADHALWQRSWLSGEVLERELAYWREQLSEAPPVLELAADRPRSAHPSYRGGALSVRVEHGLARSLSLLARREGSTLFMVLLASFQTILFRYTGQNRVAVGIPIAGRTRVEVEDLIGLFVNTLVLCGERRGNPSFRDYLGRVRGQTLEAYRHQDLPFEKLVEELSPERGLSHSPLFQTMLVLQNAPLQDLELAGLRLHPLAPQIGVMDLDLALSLSEGSDGFSGLLDYSADLFDRSTVERFWRHYMALLAGLAADPEQPLSDLALLGPAERAQVLREWNDHEREGPGERCLDRLFDAQAERRPDSSAVLFADSWLSYGELSARANQVARHLRGRGVGPEVLVGLLMERSLELPVGVWGILKAGGGYLPLDPEYPRERLELMLRDTGVKVVLGQGRLRERLPGGGPLDLICLDEDWREIAGESRARLDSRTTAENLAYVIYTSGSTGRPKGVVNRHGAVSNHLTFWTRLVPPRPEPDVLIQISPISFDLSVVELCTAFITGARLVVARPGGHRDPAYVASELVRGRVTTLEAVPAMHQHLLDEPQAGAFAALRLVIGGADVVSPELVKRHYSRLKADMVNAYGPTETTIDASCYWLWPRGELSRGVPIGRAIDNGEIYLVDRRLQPAPLGVPGELVIGGGGVTRGYWKRPGLTAEKFVPHPFGSRHGSRLYRTGDLARTRTDGLIHFLGRVDHQVKLRGFRIELGEVESVMRESPKVKEAVAAVRQDPVRGKVLVGYVAIEGGDEALDELQGLLQERLPDHMVPGHLMALEPFPLTPTGKVDRRALPAPEWGRRVGADADEAPRTPDEEAIAGIWREVLGLERLGVTESFFQLGGHSLLATQIVARVRSELGVELALQALFESPTVRGLAEAVDRERQAREAPGAPPPVSTRREVLVPIQRRGDRPPFFCVHPVGGDVLCYFDLAHRLGGDQPFYGLQSPTPAPDTGELEEMARSYLREIRRVQPVGPYFVGGWSLGGVVAFEAARQLTEEGERVGQLVLIDSSVPDASRSSGPSIEIELLGSFLADLLELSSAGSAGISDYAQAFEERFRDVGAGKAISADQLGSLFEQVLEAGVLPAGLTTAQLVELYRTFRFNALCLDEYAPRVFAGPATLFLAQEPASSPAGDSRDWSGLLAEAPNLISIPGNHYTILRSPYCEVLAGHLRTVLAGSGSDRSSTETNRSIAETS